MASLNKYKIDDLKKFLTQRSYVKNSNIMELYMCVYVDVIHIITTTRQSIEHKYCAVVFYANKIIIYHTLTYI